MAAKKAVKKAVKKPDAEKRDEGEHSRNGARGGGAACAGTEVCGR